MRAYVLGPKPAIYTVNTIPVSSDDIVKDDLWNLSHLQVVDFPDINADIEALVGRNVPQAIEFLGIIPSPTEGEPFATRTKLGWVVFEAGKGTTATYAKVKRVKVEDVPLDNILTNMQNHELMNVN